MPLRAPTPAGYRPYMANSVKRWAIETELRRRGIIDPLPASAIYMCAPAP